MPVKCMAPCGRRLRGLAGAIALATTLLPGVARAESPNELIPNGSFENTDAKGAVVGWWAQMPGAEFVTQDGSRVLHVVQGYRMAWEMPGKAIGNTEYVFSFRMKGENLPGNRLGLWAQLPDQHEPPGGPKFSPNKKGTFDWTPIQVKFRMPRGITRFTVFFDGFGAGKGSAWFDDFRLRPADDTPLEIETSAASAGMATREQMTWIWSEPGFPWQGANMNKESVQPVPPAQALFRRTITCPPKMVEPQAVFTGDDAAVLSVNGRAVGGNQMWQNIVRLPLAGVLKPGRNVVVFKVDNAKGPAGLLGRIEWRTPPQAGQSSGSPVRIPTNGRWETSTDGGRTWKSALPVALPVPAPAQYHWAYPHLEKLTYSLAAALPEGVTGARMAVRSTGGFRVLADGKEVWAGSSSGVVIKSDLSAELKGAKNLTLVLEDIAQPPLGQAVLQVKRDPDGGFESIPLGRFRAADGKAPAAVAALYPERSWPVNVGAFEAAATRPVPNRKGRLEPWAKSLLAGSRPIFTLGRDDDSSAEFGPIEKGAATATTPVTATQGLTRGLESKLRPEFTVRFPLSTVPASGAAFVLDVEDTDANVNGVGVFVNGVLCGSPQIIGYDQIPGGRKTNRAWVVTIPRERFVTGTNTLTLRFLPSYYQAAGQEPENQAQEIIQQLNLRDRSESPYPTSAWLHWDTLYLAALAQPAAEPINGRPVHMGTNMGYTHTDARGLGWWNEFVLRDFSYLGMAHSDSPIRFGISIGGQFAAMNVTGKTELPSGQTVGDYMLSTLIDRGMRPYLIADAGRDTHTKEAFPESFEVKVIQRYGRYFDRMEIGNEIDNPYYRWDALRMSMAYANIQRQSTAGQMLKAYDPDKNLQIMGEGWYHAWDFSVMDAQQRREGDADPAWTDHLSAHNYGKSYIIPAVIYSMLYGVNAPKPIWVTECGSYTADDVRINDFDLNLRGNLAYADYIVQYLAHPYNGPMERFALFSARDKDARVLEKARAFRRLLHAYALHGKPLPWQYADPSAMRDKLVLVNPVDTGKAFKISFVNLSREPQAVDVRVTLPASGPLRATRYGDGVTVAEGTREVTLQADPNARFNETLAPGEAVEYLIEKTASGGR